MRKLLEITIEIESIAGIYKCYVVDRKGTEVLLHIVEEVLPFFPGTDDPSGLVRWFSIRNISPEKEVLEARCIGSVGELPSWFYLKDFLAFEKANCITRFDQYHDDQSLVEAGFRYRGLPYRWSYGYVSLDRWRM